MRHDDFDFDLPRRLIADHPCDPRDAARLLLIPVSGRLQDGRTSDLPGLLRPGDLLVFNDTKVIPARLAGRRGARAVELTLHRDLGGGVWRAFAKGARRLRVGDRIVFAKDFSADVAAKHPEGDLILRFDLEGEAFHEALARYGMMPLPPYIKRRPGGDPRDRADYQTIFARAEGAVAAPTAGLHFTAALLTALAERGIGWTMLTLHVGPGTFLPVKTVDPRDHRCTPNGARFRPRQPTVSRRPGMPAGVSLQSAQPASASWRARRPKMARSGPLPARPDCSFCPATGSGRSTCC
jgi:S-adenosylmethionine:tRNA ribosyltransferase-isomerase